MVLVFVMCYIFMCQTYEWHMQFPLLEGDVIEHIFYLEKGCSVCSNCRK